MFLFRADITTISNLFKFFCNRIYFVEIFKNPAIQCNPFIINQSQFYYLKSIPYCKQVLFLCHVHIFCWSISLNKDHMQFDFLLLTNKYWLLWLLCCKCKKTMVAKKQLTVTTNNYHNLLITFMFTSYFEVNCFVNPCLYFLIRSQNKDIILNQSFSSCLSLFFPLLILEYLLTWPILLAW